MALNAHSLKQLDCHIDLPLSMNTLVFFLIRKVPHMRISSQRIFRISFANFIEHITRNGVYAPCLRVVRARRPFRRFNDVIDNFLGHWLIQEPSSALS